MDQIVYAIIFTVFTIIVLGVLYHLRKNERSDLVELRHEGIDYWVTKMEAIFAEELEEDETYIMGDPDSEAVEVTKAVTRQALKDCIHGIPAAVDTAMAAIRNVLEKEKPTFKDICEIQDYSEVFDLDDHTKWEILVYIISKKLGNKKVMYYLDEKYDFSRLRVVDDGLNSRPCRCFDHAMLNDIFMQEVSQEDITYALAIDITAILIFNKMKGLGCVQTLRHLAIDGFHFGTSGSIRYLIEGKLDIPYRSTNSVWVQINAKWTHLSFLDFYSEGEMARVVNLMSSWGVAAPMSMKNPTKVNDAYDGARITTIRPPAGESWGCFVRMFSVSVKTVDWWLDKPGVKNWQLPRKLIKFLMKAEVTTFFTGQQNTGKTTLMASAIEDVEMVNIRVLEMAFELALREAYPNRDIFTVKPTDYVTSAELQDILKKTDAYLSMVGEIAQDIVAARALQFCIIASAFTIASHHAKDDDGLVEGLAQSLVACGEYKDHNVAMSTVLDAIHSNVHLDFMDVGTERLRFIEYISEIRKLDTIQPYPEVSELWKQVRHEFDCKSDNMATAFLAFAKLTREYYTRSTDRPRFTSRKIIHFNKETLTYEPGEWYSPEMMEHFMKKLHGEDRREFLEFYYENWRPNEPNPFKREVA